MNKDQQMYEDLVRLCEKRYRGFKVLYKDESLFMKIVGALAFFNPKFMKGYTTTFFSRVYFPSRAWAKEVGHRHMFKVLAHEAVHLEDGRMYGPIYQVSYIMPQILSVLALLGFFLSPIWFVALLMLLPLPAPFRKESEMRGYQMSMAVNYWRYGSVLQETKDHILGKFAGPDYYFMWPFRSAVKKEIDSRLEWIETGAILEGDWIYKSVYDLLDRNGVLNA